MGNGTLLRVDGGARCVFGDLWRGELGKNDWIGDKDGLLVSVRNIPPSFSPYECNFEESFLFYQSRPFSAMVMVFTAIAEVTEVAL